MSYKPRVLEITSGGTGVTTSIGSGSTILGSDMNIYTPTIGSATVNFITSTANGWYRTIGAITFLWIAIVWTSKNSATSGDSLRISLPTIPSSTPSFGNISITSLEQVTLSGAEFSGIINTPNQYIELLRLQSGGNAVNITCGNCGASGTIKLFGTFI